jgi:hypothetical protein
MKAHVHTKEYAGGKHRKSKEKEEEAGVISLRITVG